jgi:WD repeat-containing protein 40A
VQQPPHFLIFRAQGHADWVFGLCWLTDDLFASGARDGRVLLWSARGAAAADAAAATSAHPLASRARHAAARSKVRALAYADPFGCADASSSSSSAGGARLASLGTDGTLVLWDPAGGLRPIHSVALPHTEELVCAAGATVSACTHSSASPSSSSSSSLPLHGHVFALGSLRHVTLVDGRAGRAVGDAPGQDGGAGVRSLSLRGHLLTVGDATGRVSFLDMRTRRYIDNLPPPRGAAAAGTPPRRNAAAAAAASPSEDGTPPAAMQQRQQQQRQRQQQQRRRHVWCAYDDDDDDEPPSPRRTNSARHLAVGPGRFYFSLDAGATPNGANGGGNGGRATAAAAAGDAAATDAVAAAAYVTSLTELGLSQAVYAHAWDAGGTRLATAGGPLLCGARGCYAAVWAP